MPDRAQWVQEKLAEIEHKREVLRALEDSLAQWEREIDWSQVPPEKQAALMALAEQSVDTLKSMITKLGERIRAGLKEMAEQAPTDGDHD